MNNTPKAIVNTTEPKTPMTFEKFLISNIDALHIIVDVELATSDPEKFGENLGDFLKKTWNARDKLAKEREAELMFHIKWLAKNLKNFHPFKEQPDSGLCPTFYQTLSYRGDLELFEKFKEIETLLNKSAAGALESEALNGEEE